MSFPINIFSESGLTEAELLSIRNSMITKISSGDGQIVTSVSTPGLSSTFQIYATPAEILAAVNYALKLLDPSIYGGPMITEYQGVLR